MANENSFLENAVSYLDKIMKQKYISKSEILAVKKMIKKISEQDESYKKLFNRITTISNRVQGKNTADILLEFYEAFQEKIVIHQKKEVPEKVWLTAEYDGMFEGSCIHVKSETRDFYQGIWSSRGGSYPVSIPKHLCSEKSELQKTMDLFDEHRKKQENSPL